MKLRKKPGGEAIVVVGLRKAGRVKLFTQKQSSNQRCKRMSDRWLSIEWSRLERRGVWGVLAASQCALTNDEAGCPLSS